MRRLVHTFAAGLLLTACTAATDVPPPDTATLPPGLFDGPDQDIAVAQFAENAFADPARTYGNAAQGCQAVLALDYLAGEVANSPRWNGIDPDIKAQLLQARAEIRQAVGIAPNAPSQLVVNSLTAALNDLSTGNQDAAAKALTNPAFPAGGAQVLKTLANVPYVASANFSTQGAAEAMLNPPPPPTVTAP